MSIFAKIFGMSKHERLQEQRIQYLETELEQTKNDLHEVQSIIGSMNAEIEFLSKSCRSNKNSIRNAQRKIKAAADRKTKERKQ